MVLTYGIHQTIGPTKKLHFDSLRMWFYHTLKMFVRNYLLLIRLPLWSLMSSKVISYVWQCAHSSWKQQNPSGARSKQLHWPVSATWSEHQQALKDKLQSEFSKWYAQEVSKQLEAGKQVEEVQVDMRMSVMKEWSSRWFISAYDHQFRYSQERILEGWNNPSLGEGSSRSRFRARSPRPEWKWSIFLTKPTFKLLLNLCTLCQYGIMHL